MKSVLLYSGGLDSLCTAWLLKPDTLLYVPHGAPYETTELLACAAVGLPVTIATRTLDFSSITRVDYIVPNRNAHLVLAASLYGERILLGAVAGDRSKDKDHGFCHLITGLLNYMWQEQHWTPARKFEVLLPVVHLTKSMLLAGALKRGLPVSKVLDSYSCYTGADVACGVCKPCVRKFVALVNNKVPIPIGYFKENPWHASWVIDQVDAIRGGATVRGAEDEELLQAMDKYI